MTTTDSQNVRFAVTTSVVVHALLLLGLAWIMGLETAARLSVARQAKAREVPSVALLFPEQVIPTPALRPKLNTRQYIRTAENEPATGKPVKSDFISDRNTKAASEVAPFPDGDKPMPTSLGGARPTGELLNREHREGKLADGSPSKPAPPPPAAVKPSVTPLQPREPLTVPQLKPREMAKVDAPTVAKLMEDMDKEGGRMDATKLAIRDKSAVPAVAAIPATSPAAATAPEHPKPTQEAFSPMTRTAKVKGTITNKGAAAVDAEASPVGRFMRSVTSAVEKTWHEYRQQRGEAVAEGYLKVSFYVNREGHVDDLKFIEKSGNALMDSFTLDAILHADIAPIPKDLLPLLDDGRFPVEYEIIIQ